VIPAAPAAAIRADRDILRQALQRTAILSNEKYRGIRVTVKKNVITVQAHNPEQEEAEEEIEVAMTAAISRWASTSIICWTPWRPSTARKSSSV
jgi:DNA polymerase III sliding clamp (beta) subunit (PCNA family)